MDKEIVAKTRQEMAVMRLTYTLGQLLESEVAPDPITQFGRWFQEAKSAMKEPNAMTLCTATSSGKPSARIVLLKGMDDHGFVFFTNYTSRKSVELKANPWVSLCFYWPELERSVRVEGKAELVSDQESTEYFNSRPKTSRLGAWASPQSSVIPSRQVLEDNLKGLEEKYEGTSEVPRPPHWGGWRVVPFRVEFWQGRPSRLHDRLVYERGSKTKPWKLMRLAP